MVYIDTVYDKLCPICNEEISTKEIEEGLCYKKRTSFNSLPLFKKFKEFSEFFTYITGFELRTLQRLWAKRILQNKSFSAISPTGIGKSLFGLITSLYFAKQNKKSYILVPTTLLVETFYDKIKNYNKINAKIIRYHSDLKTKEKKEISEIISSGEFDILITTINYLSKNYQKLKKSYFKFIFVDDIDAILKKSKNVTKLLSLVKENTILMVSSATAKPGKSAELFRKKLGFSIGYHRNLVRNIIDTTYNKKDIESLRKILRKLKDGGLIFTHTIEEANEIYNKLKDEFKIAVVFSENKEKFDEFEKGKLNFLIGVARSNGALVRGLDLPERIKFAVFYGIPHNKITIDEIDRYSDTKTMLVARLFNETRERAIKYIKKKQQLLYRLNINNIDIEIVKSISENKFEDILKNENNKNNNDDEEKESNSSKTISQKEIEYIREQLKKNKNAKEEINNLFKEFNKIKEKVKLLLKEKKIDRNDLILKENTLIIPDLTTYIQASGRTSRLFANGLLLGLSIVLDNDENIRALKQRAIFYNIEFEEISLNQLDDLVKKVTEDRQRKTEKKEKQSLITQKLLIVESPTKAKQIAYFFGKPSIRTENNAISYEVTTGKEIIIIIPTLGHVSDLVEDKEFYGVKIKDEKFIPIYATIKKCKKCGYQFTRDSEKCPKCGSEEIYNSKNQIEVIRNLSFETENVIIATDPDSEGEKIAWDVYNLVKPFSEKILRAEFHEVTKKAIVNALENLREIDLNRVKAQIVRRIEDRWIGFRLSNLLQKRFKEFNLSAGRAQTPVLGWIVESTKQHKEKIPYIINDLNSFEINKDIYKKIKNELNKYKLNAKINSLRIESKEYIIPPFTTDSLLKYASRILKFSPEKTMRISQELFESGLITYHRTDSTNISSVGYEIAKTKLQEEFKFRSFKSEGAHECIRPTKPLSAKEILNALEEELLTLPIKFTKDHFALYHLIFRRFLAALSEINVKEVRLKVDFTLTNNKETFEFNNNSIAAVIDVSGKGYELWPYDFKINEFIKEQIEKNTLKENSIIDVSFKIELRSKPLLTFSDIISLMKNKKIGRPSTYATIIKKLLDRNYIRENKVVWATRKGFKIFYYLDNNFHKFVSEERTRILEEKVDKVEKGLADYQELIKALYEEIKEI